MIKSFFFQDNVGKPIYLPLNLLYLIQVFYYLVERCDYEVIKSTKTLEIK